MGSSPAFSFYAKDFLAGTATMSLAEVGAYVRLLCYQWDSGSVPADPDERARLLGCAKAQERDLWRKVGKKFILVDDTYINERLEAEREKQAERRRRLSENGKQGGRPPKPNTKPNESNSFPIAKANENLNERLAFSSSSSGKDLVPVPKDRTPRTTLTPPAFERWYAAYPKKIKRQDALKAWLKINPDPAMVDRMLAALAWQRTQPMWVKDGGQFIPYPASYLNSGSYDDEPFHAPNLSEKSLRLLQTVTGGSK